MLLAEKNDDDDEDGDDLQERLGNLKLFSSVMACMRGQDPSGDKPTLVRAENRQGIRTTRKKTTRKFFMIEANKEHSAATILN